MKTNQKTTYFDFSALANMCEWERKKAIYLLFIADEIGFDYSSGSGSIGVNNSSGYTYLWSENYSFCLFMPISCELEKTDVCALWTNPDTGYEIEIELEYHDNCKTLIEWAETL